MNKYVAAVREFRWMSPGAAWLIGGLIITCLSVLAAIQAPIVLFGLIIGATVISLMRTALGRLLVFAGGSLAIFQSAAIGTTARGIFVALLIVGLLPGLQSIHKAIRTSNLSVSRYFVPIVAIAMLFLLSIPFLATGQVELSSWFRDATTYMLILVGAVYGLDAGLSADSGIMRRAFAVIGIVGAFAFLVAWLDRRGVPLGELGQFALSSSMMVVPVISMSLAILFGASRIRTWQWAIVAVVQISMLLGSGGRSGVIFLSALLAFVALVVWRRRRALQKLIGFVVASFVVLYLGFRAYSNLVGESFLINRFDWFQDVSLDAVESDGSGQARLRAYDIMWQAFLSSPLIGNGLGHIYPGVSASPSVIREVFALDTPLVYLAKFGIIGTAVLVGALCAIVRISCTLAGKGTNSRQQAFLMCGATVSAWLATLPSGAPTEQKGFGIGLAILIAMSVSWAKEEPNVPQKDFESSTVARHQR